MASFDDLQPCEYLPVHAEHILAVGWLDKQSVYTTGSTPQAVYERLVSFAKTPWQPFVCMGGHTCDICQFKGEQTGHLNFFLPYEGKILVCPELIIHYINAHRYRPPDLFCSAVLNCPDVDSMAYKRQLIECNGRVLWEHRSDHDSV